jgi:hypothetical protein
VCILGKMAFEFGDPKYLELSMERIDLDEAVFKLLNVMRTKWQVQSFDWLSFKYEQLLKEIEQFNDLITSFGLHDIEIYEELKDVFRQYWRGIEYFKNEIFIFMDDYEFAKKALHF